MNKKMSKKALTSLTSVLVVILFLGTTMSSALADSSSLVADSDEREKELNEKIRKDREAKESFEQSVSSSSLEDNIASSESVSDPEVSKERASLTADELSDESFVSSNLEADKKKEESSDSSDSLSKDADSISSAKDEEYCPLCAALSDVEENQDIDVDALLASEAYRVAEQYLVLYIENYELLQTYEKMSDDQKADLIAYGLDELNAFKSEIDDQEVLAGIDAITNIVTGERSISSYIEDEVSDDMIVQAPVEMPRGTIEVSDTAYKKVWLSCEAMIDDLMGDLAQSILDLVKQTGMTIAEALGHFILNNPGTTIALIMAFGGPVATALMGLLGSTITALKLAGKWSIMGLLIYSDNPDFFDQIFDFVGGLFTGLIDLICDLFFDDDCPERMFGYDELTMKNKVGGEQPTTKTTKKVFTSSTTQSSTVRKTRSTSL